MKKSLTQNISRYDNKIRVRYNLHTLRILLVSLAAGIAVILLLRLCLSLIYAIGIGALISLVLFGVQIVEVNGTPLLRQLLLLFFPLHYRQYEHSANRPEDRLDPDQYIERRTPSDDKRQQKNS